MYSVGRMDYVDAEELLKCQILTNMRVVWRKGHETSVKTVSVRTFVCKQEEEIIGIEKKNRRRMCRV